MNNSKIWQPRKLHKMGVDVGKNGTKTKRTKNNGETRQHTAEMALVFFLGCEGGGGG
jgi:hypothetical protein